MADSNNRQRILRLYYAATGMILVLGSAIFWIIAVSVPWLLKTAWTILTGFIGIGLLWRTTVGWEKSKDVLTASQPWIPKHPPDAQGPFE